MTPQLAAISLPLQAGDTAPDGQRRLRTPARSSVLVVFQNKNM